MDQLTGQQLYNIVREIVGRPDAHAWDECTQGNRDLHDKVAVAVNVHFNTRNMLQKKVLTHLLIGLRAEVQHMGCDEEEVGGITDEERQNLTKMLYEMSGEEWDGVVCEEFSLSSLCQLALSWVGGV